MLPEGTLAEIINGLILMSPAPSPAHQQTTRELAFAILTHLKEHNKGGQLFFAPCDVFLDEHSNAVQPDIIFISPEKESIIKADAIHGVPDLVIEVLSPGNSQHDLVTKRSLYEKFGIPEYWTVKPETKETVGFLLKDRKYVELDRDTGKIHSVFLGKTTFAF